MKLCLSARLWEGSKGYTITLPDFLDVTAELGYQGIELRYPLIPPPEKLGVIGAHAKRLGLTVVFSTCAALPRDAATRADALRVLDAVKFLGGSDIRATMTSDNDYAPMRELADLAAGKGIKVAMQVHTNTLCDTVAKTEQCLEKLNHSNVRLIFDPTHLQIMGDIDIAGGIQRLIRWMDRANAQNYALHGAGYQDRQKIPIGGQDWARALPGEKGGLDFAAYVKALRVAGFKGWMNVMCDVEPGMNSKEVAKQYRHFLNPLLA